MLWQPKKTNIEAKSLLDMFTAKHQKDIISWQLCWREQIRKSFRHCPAGNRWYTPRVSLRSLTKGQVTEVWELRRDGANPGTSNSGRSLADLDLRDKGREQCCWSPWIAVAVKEK